jgi:hypothetical protein
MYVLHIHEFNIQRIVIMAWLNRLKPIHLVCFISGTFSGAFIGLNYQRSRIVNQLIRDIDDNHYHPAIFSEKIAAIQMKNSFDEDDKGYLEWYKQRSDETMSALKTEQTRAHEKLRSGDLYIPRVISAAARPTSE